jgi:hypothetical protein
MKNVRLSHAAQSWLLLNGEPFSFEDWPMHIPFYDGRYRRTLFMTSRQVAKSTTLANFQILECSLIPHFSSMFVSPTKEQTVRFSNTRVGKTMRYSPIINKTFLHSTLADRVFHKEFTNGSEMLFTYGSDDADRLRGPSTDRNMYDEVQDLLYDPIITVGNETMSKSKYALETYAGTPKSMENTIQYLWDISTQTEWVIKCDSCGRSQYIRTDKSLGLRGPICLSCGAYLNPFRGVWVDTNPNKDADKGDIKGFHLSQLIMPFNVPAAVKHRGVADEEYAYERWKRILKKHQENPSAVFNNEVLGVSDAVGTRMLALEDLHALCTTRPINTYPAVNEMAELSILTAGVDWSGGGTSGVSRTVLWIWGWRPRDQKIQLMMYKIFAGQNPVHIVEEIAQICSAWNVSLVAGDAGEGHLANNQLKHKIGEHRVVQLQYGSNKKAMVWNGEDRYHLDRTTLIDNYFMMIKNKNVEFASIEAMTPAFDDIMNEYEEKTAAEKKVWRHSPHKPDDSLHAGLFAWVALKIRQNDIKFYQ